VLETVSVNEWNRHVKNDFEPGIFAGKPQLQQIKNHLYDIGAYYAAMSGSGSTIYGFFESTPEHLSFPDNYTVKVLQVQ
jgi:4-diphosphocytidyl-2-C-methyl-D-erythritol kinase